MRTSVSTRIFMGFALVILTFCVVSSYSVYKMHRIHGRLDLIQGGYLRLSLTLTEIDADLRGYEVVLDERDPDLLTRSLHMAAVLHPFPAIIRRHLGQAIRGASEAADRGEGIEEQERVGLLRLRDQLRALMDRMDEVEALSGELSLAVGEREFERATDVQRRLKVRTRSLRRELKRMSIALRHDIDASILAAESAETQSFWGVVALSVVAVALSVVVTLLAQMTLHPIQRLTEAVKRFREGGEPGVVHVRSRDEVGLLASEFERLVETLRTRDAQLRRSERLATIGRMSAQVAHEVRNPLQSIGLNSELLEEELLTLGAGTGEMDAVALVRSIQREAERLNEITEDYLRLARLPSPETEPTSLNALLEELLGFVRELLTRAEVVLVTDLDPDLPTLALDGNQVRQALHNLVRNSLEAMPDGGRLRIVTRRVAGAVEVEISDNGQGIGAEALPQVFEPFFSTKNGGTGLGLALTRSIIEANGGSIECHSAGAGAGASFLLRLRTEPEEGA